MIAVSFLPDRLDTHFHTVLQPGDVHKSASTWEAVLNTVQRSPVDVLVADPTLGAGGAERDISQLFNLFPSLPVVLYTTFTQPALGATARLARQGARHYLLYRYDDSVERFRDMLDRIPDNPIGAELADRLAQATQELPRPVAQMVRQAIMAPYTFRGVESLAAGAGIKVLQLYRLLARVGIRTPMRLLVAARLAHAYSYLQEPGYSVSHASLKVGFRHSRVFARHTVAALGSPPSRARRLPQEEVLTRLYNWVRSGSEDGGDSPHTE